jgi:hypothetical protein
LNIKPENYSIYKAPVARFIKLCSENNLTVIRGTFVPDEVLRI